MKKEAIIYIFVGLFLLFIILTTIFSHKISAEINPANCKEVYSNHNNATNTSRFNIVFVGVGFETTDDLNLASQRVIHLSGTAPSNVKSDGLMQIPVFKDYNNSFNFCLQRICIDIPDWFVCPLSTGLHMALLCATTHDCKPFNNIMDF